MRKQAVTLIELTVVMAIVGIVGIGAMLSTRGYRTAQYENDNNLILTDTSWVRQRVINEDTDYRISFNTATDSYTIERWNAGSGAWGPTDIPVRKMQYADITHAPATVTFSPVSAGSFGRIGLTPAGGTGWQLGQARILINRPDDPTNINTEFLVEEDTGTIGIGRVSCFIATATYSNREGKIPEEVLVLRKFRDQYLMTNRIGMCFVGLYYEFSPTLAKFIRHHPWAKTTTRVILSPIVWVCDKVVND